MITTQMVLVAVLAVVFAIFIWVWFYRSTFFTAKKKAESPSLAAGMYHLAVGRQEEALRDFKYMLTKGASLPEIYMSIAVLCRLKADVERAVHINETLLLRQQVSPDVLAFVLKELIKGYRISGNMRRAEECLMNIADMDTCPEMYVLHAEIALFKGDFEGAVRKYLKYAKANDVKPVKELANVYIKQAMACPDMMPKMKALRSAVKYDPDSAKAYFLMAEAYSENGNSVASMDLCREMIGRDLFRSREDIKRLEELFYKNSTLEELYALMLKRIVEESPHPVPYLFVSKYYDKKGDSEKAALVLENYIVQHAPKVIVKKAYATRANDPLLMSMVRDEYAYCCAECAADFSEYEEICPRCGGIDTIDYQ